MSGRRRFAVSPFGVLIGIGIANHMVLAGSRVAVSLDALAQGADPATVGVLLALYAVLPMVLAIPAGRLADRIGVRRPMLVGSSGIALGARSWRSRWRPSTRPAKWAGLRRACATSVCSLSAIRPRRSRAR
jgi:MFS family permease